jgi:hypothetical protein
MSAAGVSERLREVGRLLEQRGFVSKQVDMGPSAVTARLKTLGALADMCRRLAPIGAKLSPAASAGRTEVRKLI